jgi:large subunit ribosomal protein L28
MAYACDRCGKGVMIGRHVSHAKNRTRKISLPNLQPFRGVLNGKFGRWRLCTKCLRTVKKAQKPKKETKTEKAKPAPKKPLTPKAA